MPKNRLSYLSVLCLLTIAPALASPPEKVVSLGGTVTEIVYELGLEKKLVGTDLSSIYPPAATSLPSVGYYRSLPIEGLIALAPDIVLASEQSGPEQVLDRIRALGIRVEMIDDQASLESLYTRIDQIAHILGAPERGKALQKRVREHVPSVVPSVKPVNTLVLMSHGHQMRGAGAGTAPALLLQLAGMRNVLESQKGYRSISGEAVAALAPEVIIMTGSGATTDGSRSVAGSPTDDVSTNSGILLTPAAKYGTVTNIDPLLMLGIGPRIGESLALLEQLRERAVRHSGGKPS